MSQPSGIQHFDASYARIDSAGGHNFSYNVGKVEVTGTGNIVNINSERMREAPRLPAPRCPPASPNFVGRAEEQERMWKFFFGDSVRFDQRRVFLLIGMGGCGKTQLARKFMARVYRKFRDTSRLVFYVDATTVETLKTSLVAIAKANGVGDSSEAALAWMSALDNESFLYFDNADDPNINLRDYFPDSDHVRILITTRLRESQQHYGSGRGSAIHLGALSEDEATELLELTAGIDPDAPREQATVTLVQELHLLPLAIVQAGAAIFKSQWTVDEYHHQFLQLRTALMDGRRDRVDSKAIDDYPMHVYTTWKLSYDRLSESSATLLRLCAYLHHTGITEDLFELASKGLADVNLSSPPVPFIHEEQSARSFLESFMEDGEWDKAKFRWTIQEACAFSLISYDITNHVYSIHPLVHDCLQSITPHPFQAAFLLAASIRPLWGDKPRLAPLVPHAQRVLHTSEKQEGGTLHPILSQHLGQCFWHAGLHVESQSMYEAALRGLADHLSSDHDTIVFIQNDLALAMVANGCYTEAEALQTQILNMQRATLGPNHAESIQALANLAATLRFLGRYAEAEKMEREILEKRQATLGRDHIETVTALANLAATLRFLGSYTEAEKMEREVLEKKRTIFGCNHIETVIALANLAGTLGSLGRYTEAEEMEIEVLETTRTLVGPDHDKTIIAMANLAVTLSSLGRHAEAERLERQVLEKRRAILGPNHIATIRTLANLAATLFSLGRYSEAEEMEREALDKRRTILGRDHVETITALANLAATLRSLGRYTEAEKMQREVLAKRQTIFGSNHIDTLTVLGNLAATLRALDRYTEAEEMEREVLEKTCILLGPDHDRSITALGILASTLCSLGRYLEAEKMEREVLERSQALFGPNHVDTILAMANLSVTLYFLGHYTEAEEMEKEILEKRQMVLGGDHTETLKALVNLALTYSLQGRHDDALPMVRQAVEGYNRTVGPDHPSSHWAQRQLDSCIALELEAMSLSEASAHAAPASERQSIASEPTRPEERPDAHTIAITASPSASNTESLQLSVTCDAEHTTSLAPLAQLPSFPEDHISSLSLQPSTCTTAAGRLTPTRSPSPLLQTHIRLGLPAQPPTSTPVPLLAALTNTYGFRPLQRDSQQLADGSGSPLDTDID